MNRYYLVAIIFVVLAGSFWSFRALNKPSRPVQALKNTQEPVVASPESVPVKARIAIVLDDWGYSGSVLPFLLKIRGPVTIAILPNHKFSASIAREAEEKGYQVILHLPLESQGNASPEKDTLYCAMSEKDVRSKVRSLLKSVPGIIGVNNHQGSKATEDSRMMGIVLSEIKKEKLFFLDSRTTGKSASPKVAQSLGIRFAQSDGFIDLPPTHLQEKEYREYVRKNLDQLVTVALKRGQAVGIGHDLKVTMDVLRTEMPRLEKKGIRFVFLSELVR